MSKYKDCMKKLELYKKKGRSRKMNRVILMGRLTRDPEIRYSGRAFHDNRKYTLAVDQERP